MTENLELDALSGLPPVDAAFIAGLHPQLDAQLVQVQSQAQAQMNPGYGVGENGGGASAGFSREHLQVESTGRGAHSPDASAATVAGGLFGPAALIGAGGTDERAGQNIDALWNSNWLLQRYHDSSRQCAFLVDFEKYS